MNSIFPLAPASLPSGMPGLLVELARLWAENPKRPKPDSRVLEHWDRLIAAWRQTYHFRCIFGSLPTIEVRLSFIGRVAP